MPRVVSTFPRFHDVVTLRVQGRPGGVRVVVTEDGAVLPSFLAYLMLPRHKLRSLAWQSKTARAVGLLYDYHRAVAPPVDVGDRREYLSEFVGRLLSGTVAGDGSDPTGLGWRRVPWGQVREVLRSLNGFTDYCTDEFGASRLNPEVAASFPERIAAYRALDIRNSSSLLKHLGNSKAAHAAAQRSREVVAPQAPGVRRAETVAFPAERFHDLLYEGFRVPGTADSDPPWVRYHLRDMLVAMLQRHGGCRASEPLHVFVRDVARAPYDPRVAEVRLYHPVTGRFTIRNAVTGRVEHVARAEYLETTYGRVPRNQLATKERAGWKNLMLDYGESHGNYALVRWLSPEAGAEFWDLLQLYVRHVLGRVPASDRRHPYLFVNLDGPTRGAPYRLGAYYQNLAAAARRIGLASEKERGTTSHGLRHRYARDLAEAKVPAAVIKVCLHHNSLGSQQAYTEPDNRTIHAELDAGWRRLYGPSAPALGAPGASALPAASR